MYLRSFYSLITLLLTLALGVAASPLLEERSTLKCVTADISTVKRTVTAPTYFCKWWNSDVRTRTPFLELTVSQVNTACKCISPIQTTKKSKRAEITLDSTLEKRQTPASCRKEVGLQFTEPTHFCTFYNAYPRTTSPFEKYTAKELITLCNCVEGVVVSSISKKTSSSTKKTSSTKISTSTEKTSTSSKKTSTSSIKTSTSSKKTSTTSSKSSSARTSSTKAITSSSKTSSTLQTSSTKSSSVSKVSSSSKVSTASSSTAKSIISTIQLSSTKLPSLSLSTKLSSSSSSTKIVSSSSKPASVASSSIASSTKSASLTSISSSATSQSSPSASVSAPVYQYIYARYLDGSVVSDSPMKPLGDSDDDPLGILNRPNADHPALNATLDAATGYLYVGPAQRALSYYTENYDGRGTIVLFPPGSNSYYPPMQCQVDPVTSELTCSATLIEGDVLDTWSINDSDPTFRAISSQISGHDVAGQVVVRLYLSTGPLSDATASISSTVIASATSSASESPSSSPASITSSDSSSVPASVTSFDVSSVTASASASASADSSRYIYARYLDGTSAFDGPLEGRTGAFSNVNYLDPTSPDYADSQDQYFKLNFTIDTTTGYVEVGPTDTVLQTLQYFTDPAIGGYPVLRVEAGRYSTTSSSLVCSVVPLTFEITCTGNLASGVEVDTFAIYTSGLTRYLYIYPAGAVPPTYNTIKLYAEPLTTITTTSVSSSSSSASMTTSESSSSVSASETASSTVSASETASSTASASPIQYIYARNLDGTAAYPDPLLWRTNGGANVGYLNPEIANYATTKATYYTTLNFTLDTDTGYLYLGPTQILQFPTGSTTGNVVTRYDPGSMSGFSPMICSIDPSTSEITCTGTLSNGVVIDTFAVSNSANIKFLVCYESGTVPSAFATVKLFAAPVPDVSSSSSSSSASATSSDSSSSTSPAAPVIT